MNSAERDQRRERTTEPARNPVVPEDVQDFVKSYQKTLLYLKVCMTIILIVQFFILVFK